MCQYYEPRSFWWLFAAAASFVAVPMAAHTQPNARPVAGAASILPAQLQPAQAREQAPAATQAEAASQPQPQPQPSAPGPAGGCDASCIRQNAEFASQVCAPRIEAEAPTDFEWVSRPFAKIFQQADPPEGSGTVVRYRGDSIRFLSPQREWVRVTYECGFDSGKRAVEYVRVRLGRIDKPHAPAEAQPKQAPPGPQQTQAQAGTPQPAAAPTQKRLRPNEPSEIEIRQVDPRIRTPRP